MLAMGFRNPEPLSAKSSEAWIFSDSKISYPQGQMRTAPLFQILKMVLAQIGPQRLERRPEPEAITSSEGQVTQYEAVMSTKLAIAYAIALETLHRSLPQSPSENSQAADLAAGPGFFSLALIKFLQLSRLDGFDLSPRMVESARQLSEKTGLAGHLFFHQQDIRNLRPVEDSSMHLTTFTDAAHHLPNLEDVKKVLREMDRVTRPDGLIFVMDLVRLRTAELTESYVETLGADYRKKGLSVFLEDFRYSMYAAFRPEELAFCVPLETTQRVWVQIIPRFLPSLQMLIGLPIGRKTLFVREGPSWNESMHPVENSMRFEWQMARMSILTAKKIFLKQL